MVFIPSEKQWAQSDIDWASARREEIAEVIVNHGRKRDIKVIETDLALKAEKSLPKPIPGSLESTPGGARFEKEQLFDPMSKLSKSEVKEVWLTLERRFAEEAKGEINLFVDWSQPNSFFNRVSLPTSGMTLESVVGIARNAQLVIMHFK